jgi:hypothetical protein
LPHGGRNFFPDCRARAARNMVNNVLTLLQAIQFAEQSPWHGRCKSTGVALPPLRFIASTGFEIMFFSVLEEVVSFASVVLFIAAIAVWSDVLMRF